MPPDRKITVTAAIYARYSSDMQNPESANEQIIRIKHYINQGKIQLVKYSHESYQIQLLDEWVIKDEKRTGKVITRKGYQHIIEGIQNKAFQVLLVDDLSRLTRCLGDQISLYNLLKCTDIELFSLCDGISSEAHHAKTHFLLKGVINDLGNDNHAMRTRRGQEVRVLQGFSSGDICFGYTSHPTKVRISGNREVPSHYAITVVPEEAKVINLIFDYKTQGLDNTTIANELNKQKIPSSKRSFKITGKQYNWSARLIKKILTQEKYIGIWQWGKTTHYENPINQKMMNVEKPSNTWLAHFQGQKIRDDLTIVPLDKWQTVQNILLKSSNKDKKSYTKNSKTLLSGILLCHECSSVMTQVSGQRGGYYGCRTYYREDKRKCTNNKSINRHKIERIVIEHLQTVLTDQKNLKLVTHKINYLLKQSTPSIDEQIKDLIQSRMEFQKEIDSLIKRITSGNISPSITVDLNTKEQKIKEIQEKITLTKSSKTKVPSITYQDLKLYYESLFNIISDDSVTGNIILKYFFPNQLTCRPIADIKNKYHNQHNSHWEIIGSISIKGIIDYYATINSKLSSTQSNSKKTIQTDPGIINFLILT